MKMNRTNNTGKKMRKTMAWLLTAAMIMAMAPMAVFADEETTPDQGNDTPIVQQGNGNDAPENGQGKGNNTLTTEQENENDDPAPAQKNILSLYVDDQSITYSGKNEDGTFIVLDTEDLIQNNVEIVSGLAEGDELKSLTLHSSRTDAGFDWFMGLGVDENNQVLATIVNKNGEDVTGNYTIQLEELIALNIRKAVATIEAEDHSKTSGELDPELTAVVKGLFGNDTIDYSISREAGENAGDYTITVTGPAETDNYIIEYVDGTFTIKAKKSHKSDESKDNEEIVTPDDQEDEPSDEPAPADDQTNDTSDEPAPADDPADDQKDETSDNPAPAVEPTPAADTPAAPAVIPAAAPRTVTVNAPTAPILIAAATETPEVVAEAEEIMDDETPLAASAQEITDENVPLAQDAPAASGTPWGMIIAGLAILIALAAVIVRARKRA